jgi:hypothetical protein
MSNTHTEDDFMNFNFSSYDLYYTGNIVQEIDKDIDKFVTKTLKKNFSIKAEWYYSEFTMSNPSYRLIGFELDRKLTNIERFQLTDMVIYNFQSMVKPQ